MAQPLLPYLGAGLCTVHDGVAAVEREGVLQLGQALLCEIVSGVDHPAIGLGKQSMSAESGAGLDRLSRGEALPLLQSSCLAGKPLALS